MKRANSYLFFLGLFSELHVRLIGSLALSEVYMFLVAPLIFIADADKLRRHGFMPFIYFTFLAMMGCVFSSIINATPFPMAIRGFASVYSLFAIPVVLHRYISKNMAGLKWLILGVALSAFASVFGMQSGVEVASGEIMEGGVEATELYFVRHFGGLISVWYRGWYMSCPTAIAAILMFIPILQMLMFTATGRSALFVALISLFMLLYVNRRVDKMRNLKKHILLIGFIGMITAVAFTQGYKYAAINGMLTEGARNKYEYQTRKGGGPLALLMSGRGDVFTGFMACCDRPIFGFGPWAVDDGYYWTRFLLKFGDDEDIEKFHNEQKFKRQQGIQQSLIPAHSHIVGFWLWYGILALPLWIYVLKEIIVYMRRYMDAVPQWFAILACGAPGIFWNIFFSPFSSRVSVSMYITCLLLAIAVGKGAVKLPLNMVEEYSRRIG